MTTSVYPAAVNLASGMLAVMIDTKSTSAADLRQRANWAYGATKIADLLGDQDAADLLHELDIALIDLASSHAGKDEVLAQLDYMLGCVRAKGQEVRQ